MSGEAAIFNGKGEYIYAVVSSNGDGPTAAFARRNYGPIGIDAKQVYAIAEGRVAAVVSDVRTPRIRPQRSHLAAHQQVLKQLMEESTPLPMTFGTIANSPEAIHRLLAHEQDNFVDQLQYVANKVEMGLTLTYDVADIFDYFVNTHPELRAVRDRVFSPYRNPTREEKIDVGRVFDHLRSQECEGHAAAVEEVLSPYCFAIKRNKCRSEREVMNLACLVEREAKAEFENSVFAAARLFDNNFKFSFNGPWAPHNFVELAREWEPQTG